MTGFGLLGHLYKMARASGVTRGRSTPRRCRTWTERARRSRDGYVSGGTRRNLDWVRRTLDAGDRRANELLLLADAQTTGGLLVVGEMPGAPVIGELVPRQDHVLIIR